METLKLSPRKKEKTYDQKLSVRGENITIIPSPKKCIELLQQTGCSSAVINHCKTVRDLAIRIAEKAQANAKLVEAGALLHDIGRSQTHGIRHGVAGAKIARRIGLPESIVLIIERHVGAGIPKEEALRVGLPEKDYLPVSLEEKIVCHADNLIDNGKKHPINWEICKAEKKGLFSLASRLQALHTELSDICGVDLDTL